MQQREAERELGTLSLARHGQLAVVPDGEQRTIAAGYSYGYAARPRIEHGVGGRVGRLSVANLDNVGEAELTRAIGHPRPHEVVDNMARLLGGGAGPQWRTGPHHRQRTAKRNG